MIDDDSTVSGDIAMKCRKRKKRILLWLLLLFTILLWQVCNASDVKKAEEFPPKNWPSFIPKNTADFKEAEELFSELKPHLFALFPKAARRAAYVEKASSLSNGASFYKIRYTLYPVAKPVSQQDMKGFKTQLTEFYDWLKQWDAMRNTKIDSRFFQPFLSKSSDQPARPEIIPRLNIIFFGDNKTRFDLNLNFITRENNTLIITCDLYMDLELNE